MLRMHLAPKLNRGQITWISRTYSKPVAKKDDEVGFIAQR